MIIDATAGRLFIAITAMGGTRGGITAARQLAPSPSVGRRCEYRRVIREPRNLQTIATAARALRRILAEVESGRLRAATPREAALVRRIEGATMALEAATQGSDADAGNEQ
jgi:hypothetical protein